MILALLSGFIAWAIAHYGFDATPAEGFIAYLVGVTYGAVIMRSNGK